MARPTDRYRGHREAERRFRRKVDIRVPGGGLGRRLTDILDWCRENIAAGAWNEHGRSERRKGEAPADFARFYFINEAAAAAFRRRWLSGDVQA